MLGKCGGPGLPGHHESIQALKPSDALHTLQSTVLANDRDRLRNAAGFAFELPRKQAQGIQVKRLIAR